MRKSNVIALFCVCALLRYQVAFAQEQRKPAADPFTLKQRLLIVDNFCDAIAFSPDGTKVICASQAYDRLNGCLALVSKKILVWDLVNNKKIQELTGHDDGVSHIAFSKDGKKVIGLVPGPFQQKPWTTQVLTWDVGTGDLVSRATVLGEVSKHQPCLSKDGKRLFTMDEDTQLLVYDIDAECKKIFSVKVSKLMTASMSPDGSTLATANLFLGEDAAVGDVAVEVWNITLGKKEAHFDILQEAESIGLCGGGLRFSGDGKVLCASLLDRKAFCWSVPHKKSLHVFDFGIEAVSADGLFVLGGYKKIISLKSGKRVAELRFEDHERLRHQPSNHLVRGASGTFVCVASEDEIRIWDLPDILPVNGKSGGTNQPKLKDRPMIPAGPALFGMPTQSGGKFTPLELKKLEEPATLKAQERACWQIDNLTVWPMTFSPDGTKVITASPGHFPDGEEQWRIATVWNIADKTVAREFSGHNDHLKYIVFSSDGKKVIGAAQKCVTIRRTDTEIIIWEAASGELVKRLTAEGAPYGLSQSGDIVLTAHSRTGQVMAYDFAKEGKKTFSAEIKELKDSVLAPNGRFAATVNKDYLVQVWELATGKEKISYAVPKADRLFGPPCMFFSQDSSVFCARSRSTYCWNLANDQMIAHFALAGIALSPNGKHLLGSAGDDVTIVSLKSQKRVAELDLKKDEGRGSSFLFSPDGRAIVGGGQRRICIWDLPKELPE